MKPINVDPTDITLKNSAVVGRVACTSNSESGIKTPYCNYKNNKTTHLKPSSLIKTAAFQAKRLLLMGTKDPHNYLDKKQTP